LNLLYQLLAPQQSLKIVGRNLAKAHCGYSPTSSLTLNPQWQHQWCVVNDGSGLAIYWGNCYWLLMRSTISATA